MCVWLAPPDLGVEQGVHEGGLAQTCLSHPQDVEAEALADLFTSWLGILDSLSSCLSFYLATTPLSHSFFSELFPSLSHHLSPLFLFSVPLLSPNPGHRLLSGKGV